MIHINGFKHLILNQRHQYKKVRGLFVRYNDDYQELVEAENVKGGTSVYSLDGENFSEEIPKAKEKNRYTVYYKVIGDFNHNGSQVGSVEAQIYYPAGLIKKDGKLVFVEFGEIATYKTTLAKYDVDGIWYYVQEGEVKPGANTLVKYNGVWFYVENSMINWNYTGLFKYGGKWFYIKNGEVQFGANTLYKYKGVWFYINKGEIDWNFTGIFYYEGLNFYIRKGELTWGFDGTITYNGKNYTIRNSTVV